MSATNDCTRHDADAAACLAAWHATAAGDDTPAAAREPEHVERYLREFAAALVAFSATAGVDVIARGHDDPLTRAVTDLFLDAFRRGRQGRGECPETFVAFLQQRRATPALAAALLDLLEGTAAPGASSVSGESVAVDFCYALALFDAARKDAADAFNADDLDGFLAYFSADAVLTGVPSGQVIRGREAMRGVYERSCAPPVATCGSPLSRRWGRTWWVSSVGNRARPPVLSWSCIG